MRQNLDLGSFVRTQVQDSLHGTRPAAEDRNDRAHPPTRCLGTIFCLLLAMKVACLSPPSPSGGGASCMHLGRGLVAVLEGQSAPLGCKGDEQLEWRRCPAVALLALSRQGRPLLLLAPPARLWAQHRKVQPRPSLSSSCPGPEDVGNPGPPKASIHFPTLSHMPHGCPGLASANLPQAYFSAPGGGAGHLSGGLT